MMLEEGGRNLISTYRSGFAAEGGGSEDTDDRIQQVFKEHNMMLSSCSRTQYSSYLIAVKIKRLTIS